MVKRLLTIAMVALTAIIGVQAQTLQRDPARQVFNHNLRTAKAPAKAASLEGTTAWGYTDATDWGALGVGSTGVVFDVAIFVPGNGVLKGTTIQGINIPVVDANMTNVSVWVRSSLTGEDLAGAVTEGPFTLNTHKSVALDEPIALPEEGVYVGYTFTNGTAYAVAYDYYGAPVANALYLQYSNTGWANYSDQFPASPLQVLVSGLEMPDYSVSVASVGTAVQLPNTNFTLPVNLVSNGGNTVTSVDVDVTLEGNTQSTHVDLKNPILSGFNQKGSFTVEGVSPAGIGLYDITVKVTKVNGIAYEGEAVGVGGVKNLTKLVQRHTVIEEFTGTGCGYCPRGWVGMEYMKENYPERFIGIAFHKYNNSDPMYYSNYPMLGLTGAPGCSIDRKTTDADPYYGLNNGAYGIAEAFELYNAELPEVDVTVAAQWNEAQTSIDITADVEFLTTPSDASLVYVLTADSLKGTTSAWKQSNYYVNYSGSEPGISDFYNGGQYGSNPVALVFNDVVINSSYNSSGTNKGQALVAEEMTIGQPVQFTYTLNGAAKTAVKSVMKKNLVTANVLVVSNATGEILNAGKAHVEMPDAIASVANSENVHTAARYNAAGQAISQPQRGLNIVRMSDGTVRKVLVK